MAHNTSHLSPIPGARLLVWHTEDNVQAVRIGDDERLYVDGKFIPSTVNDFHPSQQVINYCSSTARVRRLYRKQWAERALGVSS